MRLNAPSPGWRQIPITWKISISAVAIHVYRSPRGAWVTEFGTPWPQQFGTKTQALKKARQLAGRLNLRVFSE